MTTSITSGLSNGVYGFKKNSFGRITDRDFEWMGNAYGVEFITWEAGPSTYKNLKLGLSKCLSPDEVVTISIGSKNFTLNVNSYTYPAEECDENRNITQTFKSTVNTNPFQEGATTNLTINLQPQRPLGLLANGYSPQGATGKISLSWELVPRAEGYEIEYWKQCYPQTELISSLITKWPIPCSPATTFNKTLVPSNQLRDSKSGDDYFTYEISGLSRSTVARNTDEVYWIRVNSIFKNKKSSDSNAIAYVSHEPPPENRSDTYDKEDGTTGTVTFASIATFPVNARWNPGANDTPPVYEYVICNQIVASSQMEDEGNETTLPKISQSRKNAIVNGVESWQTTTHRDGFWKNNADDLFIITFRTGNTGCGAIVNNKHQNNTSLSEVVVTNTDQANRNCFKGVYACASSYPPAWEDATLVQSGDFYIHTSIDLRIMAYGSCVELYHKAAHEAGHALAFYGGRIDAARQHGHPMVSPSVMLHGSCGPSFYDTGVLAAMYQSRSTFTPRE